MLAWFNLTAVIFGLDELAGVLRLGYDRRFGSVPVFTRALGVPEAWQW